MIPRRLGRTLHTGAVIAVALAWVTSASAEVRIGESAGGAVVVEAHDATVGQVLDALAASHRIQFRSSNSLSRTITGTYSGKLPQVLSRILDGYNYFIQVTSSGARLHIVDVPPSDVAAASASFAAAVPTMAGSRRPVSSNVDLDEEKAAEAAAGPTAKAPPPPPPRAPTTPYPVMPTTTANGPASTRVSTNVDLDEETSR